MRVVQETENLFRLTRFGMINCFLVREADGFTLVDTGLRGSAASILSAASRSGAPIRRIVLTHAHIDHIGSLDSLMAALSSVELAAGQREARLLAKDLSLDAGENGKALRGFTGAKSRPSRLLVEGDRVGSLRAVASPGHTPGHMAYLDVRDNTLIGGTRSRRKPVWWSQVCSRGCFPSLPFFRGTRWSPRRAPRNCVG